MLFTITATGRLLVLRSAPVRMSASYSGKAGTSGSPSGGGVTAMSLAASDEAAVSPFFCQTLEQAGQLAAQRGASSRRAAGQGQRCRCQPGNMKDRPTRDFHDKTASYQKAPPHTGRDGSFCFDCTVSRPICKEEVAARISASQRGDSKTGFYKRNGCSPGGGLCAAERHFFALSSCFFGAGVVILFGSICKSENMRS